MFKIIFLLVGAGIGFGGGVYWANKNPEKAAQISAEEEKRFLEAQVQITQKIQAKLDQLQNKTASAPASKAPGNSFVGAGQSAGNTPTAAEVNDVKADAQKQQQELQEHLAKLK
jgi:hypothetical protein